MSQNTKKQTVVDRLKKYKWYIALLLLVTISTGYITFRQNGDELRTTTVKRQDITESVNASGNVQAKDYAELRFNTPSKIVWLGVKKGDRVKKWQSVASLDKRTLEKNLRKKLLDYQTNRWDFEQTQDNYDVDGRSLEQVLLTDEEKRILEKTQFGLDKSVLDVEIADVAAKDAVLVSPISGTVLSTGGLIAGENLTAANLATKIIKVADLSTLYFIAQIDEVDFGKIQVGQKVEIQLDAFPDQSFEGAVSFIGKEGEKTLSGGVTIPIEITFTKVDERLAVGLSGDADFIIAKKENVLSIPREFIKHNQGKTYVYILENGKPVSREVTVGLSTISQTEVASGVEEGQEVVLVKESK
ncbi:MAG: efflux RND transporter periplasmic adaptor subunit [Patescibacteria group bacterium]